MRRFLGALDALPRWLRWVVFLPAGLFCSYVVDDLFEILLDMSGLTNVYITTSVPVRTVVLTFVAGVTLTLFPALLSPKPWPVGIVMVAIGILQRVSTIAYAFMIAPYLRSRLFLVGGAIVVYALGGCLGLYLIRYLLPINRATPAGVNTPRNSEM